MDDDYVNVGQEEDDVVPIPEANVFDHNLFAAGAQNRNNVANFLLQQEQ